MLWWRQLREEIVYPILQFQRARVYDDGEETGGMATGTEGWELTSWAASKENKVWMVCAFWNPKARLQWHTFSSKTIPPEHMQAAIWGPSIQRAETMENILIPTTTLQFLALLTCGLIILKLHLVQLQKSPYSSTCNTVYKSEAQILFWDVRWSLNYSHP